MVKKKQPRARHFKNKTFLTALGQHCQRLRIQRGYSIDRLAKESDQLSTSVIHRLEKGAGAITVSGLLRYAQALNVEVKELLDFPFAPEVHSTQSATEANLIALDDPCVKTEAFRTLLPLYSLKAAAGYFGTGESVEPIAWVEVNLGHKLDSKMFIARAQGDSMLPMIHDRDLLVFRADPSGTRQGKIVLAQYRGPADPETGGSYTVKKYHSTLLASQEGDWRKRQIMLSPLNPEYEPILLSPKNDSDFRIIAEYLFTLKLAP